MSLYYNRYSRKCMTSLLCIVALLQCYGGVSAFTTPRPHFNFGNQQSLPLYKNTKRTNHCQRTLLTNTSPSSVYPTRSSVSTLTQLYKNRTWLKKRRRQSRTSGVLQSSSAAASENEKENDNNNNKNVFRIVKNLPPLIQFGILMILYIFHLVVLSQKLMIFPYQLIPNDKGRFQSIGLDSLAGIISFVSYLYFGGTRSNNTIPSLFAGVNNWNGTSPWRFKRRKKAKKKQLQKLDKTNKKKKQLKQSFKRTPGITSIIAFGLLVYAYFYTGSLTAFVELYLYEMAGLGVPISIAMHRSLVVLGGHLVWVAIGAIIFRTILAPQPFFGGGLKRIPNEYDEEYDDDTSVSASTSASTSKNKHTNKKIKRKYKWFTNQWKSNWLWWTIGGYFVSCWFFNIADFLNQVILPKQVFEQAGEGVVSQLINPENNDLAASIVGYIAPCISAPWWEEVLYRGFLLPALCLKMKFWWAVLTSGIIFSIHHVSVTGALPLAILGWTWAVIYAKSGNLMVTILIHALWNSKVFLGSWLGL